MDAQSGRIRSVLHVLPHPGGGGETYVDALARLDGYRFDRIYLSGVPGTPRSDRLRVLRRSAAVARAAHSHDLLHVHGEIAGAICLPTLATARSVVTLHGMHALRRTSGRAHRAAKANLRLVVRASTRTICVSQAEYDEVLEIAGGRVEQRVRLVHNGVTLPTAPSQEERAAARAEFGLAPSTVVGVYAGGLDEHKDPLLPARAVLEIARRGGSVALLVAGDGPLRPELERLAGEPGGDAIRVLGHRPDMRNILRAGDFFVLPSYREGLSFALLEAMSLGLVPIVSDAPGNPEAVGDVGLVVPRGDLEGFTAAFTRLLGDEAERLAEGQRARERIAEHFSAEEMLEKTRKVYEEALGHGG